MELHLAPYLCVYVHVHVCIGHEVQVYVCVHVFIGHVVQVCVCVCVCACVYRA